MFVVTCASCGKEKYVDGWSLHVHKKHFCCKKHQYLYLKSVPNALTGRTYEQIYGDAALIQKQKRSTAHLGKKHSAQHILNNKLAHRGQTSPNKGNTYEQIFGIERASAIRDKLVTSHLGHIPNRDTRNKMSVARLGRVIPESVRQKMRKKRLGPSPLKGKSFEERYGLEVAVQRKTKLSFSHRGDKNPAWKDGSSVEAYPQDFNRILKEQIRKRDNNKCMFCGVPQAECISKLAVHHIDYNKLNCAIQNLISLCKKCHTATNNPRKRDYWKSYFTSLLQIRYYGSNINETTANEKIQCRRDA